MHVAASAFTHLHFAYQLQVLNCEFTYAFSFMTSATHGLVQALLANTALACFPLVDEHKNLPCLHMCQQNNSQ